MKPVKAVCPGSFDPVTLGHLDIIQRASNMFESVIVLVLNNAAKAPTFSVEERVDMLERSIGGLSNVSVDTDDGLLAEYTRLHGARAIVKGLRAVSDFEYEFQMALINKKLNPEAETVFLTTSAENLYLSSSIVRQIAAMNGDISGFVPAAVHDDIRKRFAERSAFE